MVGIVSGRVALLLLACHACSYFDCILCILPFGFTVLPFGLASEMSSSHCALLDVARMRWPMLPNAGAVPGLAGDAH